MDGEGGSRRLSVDRPTALRIVAVVVAIAAIVLGVRALTGDDDEGGDDTVKVTAPAGPDFTIEQPEGWRLVPDDERAGLAGNPLAVMRRDEGQGIVIVNAPSGTERDLDRVARGLDKRLEKALPDFRKVGARVVEVQAGPGLLYSYVRTRRATAHTTLVVPTDDRTYTLNAVVPAGADDAAREVGTILFSFDV
jgi:hypothetical protein